MGICTTGMTQSASTFCVLQVGYSYLDVQNYGQMTLYFPKVICCKYKGITGANVMMLTTDHGVSLWTIQCTLPAP